VTLAEQMGKNHFRQLGIQSETPQDEMTIQSRFCQLFNHPYHTAQAENDRFYQKRRKEFLTKIFMNVLLAVSVFRMDVIILAQMMLM
jgi:hypothetical protein